jgi:two-component system phosphate regulon response regulator PhoB
MQKHILIVEDEIAIREMITFSLMKQKYNVSQCGNGLEALEFMANLKPDLMIIDWGLPKMNGMQLVEKIRNNEVHADIPIIMLTARTEENDKIQGLETGVDDYITKPLSIRELLARISALLRRADGFHKTNILQIDRIKMNLDSHQVFIDKKELPISITEFNLLKLLMKNPNRTLSREQILNHVWGRTSFVELRTVDVHVLRLRKALKTQNADGFIKTIRGAGYKFFENQ